MKSKLFSSLFAAAVAMTLLNSCATNEPDSYEAAMQKQNKKYENYLEQSQTRSESRKQKWENYSRRADEKQEKWFDKIMEL